MKQLLVLLLGVLLVAAPCLAQGPSILHVVEMPWEDAVIRQQAKLWVEAEGPWHVHLHSSTELKFWNDAGALITDGSLWQGSGTEQSFKTLEAQIDLPLVGPGQHSLEVQVTLEGAQGVLGLPLAEDYWILPLNNQEVEVRRKGETPIALQSGQWFLLQLDDVVLSGGTEIIWSQVVLEAFRSDHQASLDQLIWWQDPSLCLDPGEKVKVTLNLEGPSPGGELILKPNSYLKLYFDWELGGQRLLVKAGMNQDIILVLPPLPPGVHKVQGAVQTLLPPEKASAVLNAIWQDREASLTIHVDRSWFDFESKQLIQVIPPKGVGGALLLPRGGLHHVQKEDKILVEDDGLDVLIPLANPARPLWIGLPLAETVAWSLAEQDLASESQDFFLPIFLWDKKFSWRLVTRSGSWFFAGGKEHQVLRGKIGSLQVEASTDTLAVFSLGEETEQDGPWYWRQNQEVWRGTLSQGAWLVNVELPRGEGKDPALAIQYHGLSWRGRLSPKDLELSYTAETWSAGTRLGTRTFWVEMIKGDLRFEINPSHFKLDYKQEESSLNLQIDADMGYYLKLSSKPWEAYVRKNSQGEGELGVRFKEPRAREPWLFLTKAAGQVKNGLVLLELEQQVGYILSPWCTLYVEADLGVSLWGEDDLCRLHLGYGAGLILTPAPYVLASVGWHSREGWYLKAGVVVPFIGRKRLSDSE